MQKWHSFYFPIFLGLFLSHNLHATNPDTISTFQYLQTLVEIRGIAYESIEGKDPTIFSEKIKGFPKELIIKMPLSVSSRKAVPVSLNWIHQYLENYSGEDNTPKQIIGLRQLSEALLEQELELSESFLLKANEKSALEEANAILSEKIYDFDNNESADSLAPKKEESESEEGKGSSFFEAGWNLVILIAFLFLAILGLLRLFKVIDFNTVKNNPMVPVSGGLLKDEDPKDSDNLQEKGRISFESGDFASSIRYYYLAFILSLHEQSVLTYNPAFTNWEYFNAIIRHKFPEIPVYFVTLLFDESHYGGKAVSSENFNRFVLDIRHCISLTKKGTP